MTIKEKILVIKLGALGDFIQALGPMAAIRRHHSDAHITLLTTKPYSEFAKHCAYFDDIWIDDKPKLLNIAGWAALKQKLNKAQFTRVYDLQNNDRTAFYFNLLGSKPEWVGAVKGASHRNASPERTAGHAFDGHKQTLLLAGIADVNVDSLEWIQAKTDIFTLRKPYVLLVPGSSPDRPQKRWPAAHFARLAQILVQLGYQPVLIGGPAEIDAAENIVRECPESLNLIGHTSLMQIAVLARDAAAAVGNDTGPLHMIAATGCPTLALFSSVSNKVKHAPKGAKVEILQRDELKDLLPEDVVKSFHPRHEAQIKSAALH